MSPATRFIDTGCWLALIDEREQHHPRAVFLTRDLNGPFITAEAILGEVGNAFAAVRWRSRDVNPLNRILADRTFEIMPITSASAASAESSRTDPLMAANDEGLGGASPRQHVATRSRCGVMPLTFAY